MKNRFYQIFAALFLLAGLTRAGAQGSTAFTYQGQLRDTGTNANGTYTMTFALYPAVTGGSQIGGSITTNATLGNGLFTVNLDFGPGAFTGAPCWLDITVQSGTDSEELSPRVQVLPAPYALFAASAGTATNFANGSWNLAAGSVGPYTNVLGIFDNASLVMGFVSNGVIVQSNFQAARINIGNTTSISSDGQGGIQLGGSIQASNLTLQGDSIDFPAQSGANISLDDDGDFFFDNNVEITALGAVYFPGPGDAGGGAISGDVSGLLMDSGLQVNGYLSVIGDMGCSGCIQGSFCQNSDRNIKEKFAPVNAQSILDRVAGLPISSWNYKTDGQTRHIGPMAQDFYAAFNVGADDKHIATVDEGGVALAAIQGLNDKLKEKDAQISALEKRLSDLEALVKASANK